MTRRDKCALVGKRADMLNVVQARRAWRHLSRLLDDMGEKDIPKFNDLLRAIRRATIHAKTSFTVMDGSDEDVKQSIEDVCHRPLPGHLEPVAQHGVLGRQGDMFFINAPVVRGSVAGQIGETRVWDDGNGFLVAGERDHLGFITYGEATRIATLRVPSRPGETYRLSYAHQRKVIVQEARVADALDTEF